ncbi:hypothetical protein B0H10DRAFT_2012030, partial [Mycena sp. CBHHK59/15]
MGSSFRFRHTLCPPICILTPSPSPVAAYSQTMQIMLIPGIVVAVILFCAAFFFKDFKLLEIQNAVEVKTLDGRRAQNVGESIESEVLDAKVL